ncbi:hypothetical protein [Allonocardiopsis opalescens]|uniref:Uncharacterized protein n=1 Tax=Allonocardiopsis opalescens TaxID=1144618 RepID=A0A2T0PP75_9ACTN|nr:hypothetical protein [Allonocardiopsis opalescens]PRX90694.1 hypothetical protein CLV72_11832 [Allonocardiopsis opalescens]
MSATTEPSGVQVMRAAVEGLTIAAVEADIADRPEKATVLDLAARRAARRLRRLTERPDGPDDTEPNTAGRAA